jgi:4-amino-4-deoxy-L-arabinose transferase-like glycosyltransferase
MFCVAARAATPDSVLIFFSTLGMYFYALGTFEINDGQLKLKHAGHWFPQQTAYVILMNTAFGLAVLAKGPIGLIVPTAILGMFLLIQRLEALPEADAQAEGRLWRVIVSILRVINPIHFLKTCWYMRPITALIVVIAISAPWYILVGMQTAGDFTQLFFLNENFARATTVMENHNGSWLFYPATIAVGFFPWSIFLAPIIFSIDHQISHRTKHSPAITFLTCWVCVQVGLFSLAETKLPSYITPCYPALAILTSFCLLRWLPTINTAGIRWQYAALGTFIFAGVVTCAGLGIAASKFFPQIWWIAALGLIPVIGGAVTIYLHHTGRNQPAILSTAISSVVFCLFMFGVGTVAVDSTRQTHLILDEVKMAAEDNNVATYHCLESSWVFYAQRPIYELHRGERNEATPNNLDREAFWKKKPVVSPEDFVAAKPNAMFITTDEHVDELLSRLPRDFGVSQQTDFFLKQDRKLILIARQSDKSTRAASRPNDAAAR